MSESTTEKTALEVFEQLSAPFTNTVNGRVYPAHKWLPKDGKSYPGHITCFPYIDREQVIDRLNTVLGIDGWMFKPEPQADGSKIGVLSCCIAGNWIDKADIGTKSQTESEKGSVTDALKRAASLFGVGTYLYKIGRKTVKAKTNAKGKPVPIDNAGKVLYGDNLNIFINGMSGAQGLLKQLLDLHPELKTSKDQRVLSLWNDLK